MSGKIEYKYNENELIKQFKEYVDNTYEQHYSQNKYQATEFIIDGGHGEGFCMGNILKYAQRYGKKEWIQSCRLNESFALCIIRFVCSRYRAKIVGVYYEN